MNWTKARNLAASLTVVALLLFLPVRRLFASGYPVIDVANLQQAIVRVAKAVAQINNQIRQIQLMRSQLRSMEANLESYSDPNWRDLGLYVLELNELVNQGNSLGYSNEGVFEVFRQVHPGCVPMIPGEYDRYFGEWTVIARDTLAATLDSARHQGSEYSSTQEQLNEIRALADGAQGNLEALSANNMLQGHTAQEVAKLNQLLAASLNAQNVYFGMRLNIEASHEATLRQIVEEAREPFFSYPGNGGLHPIPANWPYGCFGCSN